NLTGQVRNIADVTTAVAKGDLSQKITVDARGEILELKSTVNIMVDQLSSFADELTRVAKEVGTEGILGGQANVEGVSGVWKDLTDNFNQLALSLTTQVRAIADVSTAVTEGDLTRQVTVEAKGEVDALKQNVNQMIANLRETTARNRDQDWLNSNLARFSGMMQGQRDLQAVSRLIMSELTPLVGAGCGAFFLMEDGDSPRLRLIASYGLKERRTASNRFKLGESLVELEAVRRRPPFLQPVACDQAEARRVAVLHEEERAASGADERGQLRHDQPRHRLQVALPLHHAAEAGEVRVEPVLIAVSRGGLAQVRDHLVDVLLERVHLALRLDGDLAGEVALGHRGGDVG